MNDPVRARTDSFKVTTIGVVTKRADTFAELMRLRKEIARVEDDLLALDRVLGLLDYQGDLEAVPPRQTRDAPFGRGQIARAVLDHLREAGKPLTAREIAEGAFGDLWKDRDDPVPLESLSRRVGKALARLRTESVVTSRSNRIGGVVWALVSAL